MPEIYHVVKSLTLPLQLADAFILFGIRNIKIFKRYFDFDADDKKSAKMEEKIDRFLQKKMPIEIRKNFQLPVTINRIISLFRPREPEDEEEEGSEEE